MAIAETPTDQTADPRERQRGFALLAKRRLYLPLAIFAADFLVYWVAVIGAVGSTNVFAKLVFSVFAGTAIALLGIVAHDAIHNSFTSVRRLNRIIGTIAFLPALHPYTRWQHHHNKIHHVYTAQLGLDNAYPPMTVHDYLTASRVTRAIYRFKRSLCGQAFYYLLDIWLPKMFLPGKDERKGFAIVDWLDLALVHGWLIVFLGAQTGLLAAFTGKGISACLLDATIFGFLIPFMMWNLFISFLTIVQHTGPDVRWIVQTGGHSTSAEKIRGTVHIALPRVVDWTFHHVMQHPAHHIHSGVPLYSLKRAEEELAARLPTAPIVARWTPNYHWHLTRDCKLYDPFAQSWCDFSLRHSAGRDSAAPESFAVS